MAGNRGLSRNMRGSGLVEETWMWNSGVHGILYWAYHLSGEKHSMKMWGRKLLCMTWCQAWEASTNIPLALPLNWLQRPFLLRCAACDSKRSLFLRSSAPKGVCTNALLWSWYRSYFTLPLVSSRVLADLGASVDLVSLLGNSLENMTWLWVSGPHVAG